MLVQLTEIVEVEAVEVAFTPARVRAILKVKEEAEERCQRRLAVEISLLVI